MLCDTPRVFASQLPPQGRILALDVGDTTIGIAVSDVLRGIASPLDTIRRSKFIKDMAMLQSSIEKQKAVGLIVGLPVNMDGSSGPRVQSTRTFVSNLQKHTELPLCFWDERLSTVAVERTMLAADLSRQRRSELVDKLAASYMLQGFLDHIRLTP